MTWLIGVLGVLGAAGALTRRSTRQVNALKLRADLVNALQDGAGRNQLADENDREAGLLAARLREAQRHWSIRWAPIFERMYLAGAFIFTAGYIGHLLDANNLISSAATLSGVGLLVIGGLGYSVTASLALHRWLRDRRLRRRHTSIP